jgi:hypothetical protein
MPENSIPDNAPYLVLGLIVTFTILGAYVASLVARFRNLQQDTQVLEQLEESD